MTFHETRLPSPGFAGHFRSSQLSRLKHYSIGFKQKPILDLSEYRQTSINELNTQAQSITRSFTWCGLKKINVIELGGGHWKYSWAGRLFVHFNYTCIDCNHALLM